MTASVLFWWACVAVGAWKVLRMLRHFFPPSEPEDRWSALGEWAVVTGGTDGIGKAYADELADRGFSVCIISRNAQKLERVAKEIEESYRVPTKTIHADFTAGPDLYNTIRSEMGEFLEDVGVLVNNVGMSYKHPEYFDSLPGGAQSIRDLISTNVTACTMMLHLILPGMLRRGSGIVVNVSSMLAVYPMPLLAVYAACKAYVDYLSRAVHYEYKNRGIFIQSLLPGYVATKMSHRRPSLEVPSPKKFVSHAMETIGLENYTYGYPPHRVRGFVHEWLRAHMPARVNLAIAMYFMSKGRESYFRKKQDKRAYPNED